MTDLRSFLAARRASLYFCFAVRKPSLASFASFLAASASFWAAAIWVWSFFLTAAAGCGEFDVMGGWIYL